MFEVVLSPEARAFYAAADRVLARKLARCFTQLETDPRRHNNIKRLTGAMRGLSRYRVGDWRIVFRIVDDEQKVFVLSVANRREIYE